VLAIRVMVRAAVSNRFSAGEQIGDYQIVGEVEIDATAVVYLATHVVLPRQAYIKVSHPGSREAAVHILREARIYEALSHPGIPRVYECGILGDRRLWCAIEVVAGDTLKQLTGAGPLALSNLIVMLRDVADILVHAHACSVVHCRLTMGAIVRSQRRSTSYSIRDWSDARMAGAEGGVVVDPKDDVRALGALAFRALTGILPESIEQNQPSPSVGTFCPSAPAELIALIDQMLTEPVARPAAIDVFERALWLYHMLEGAAAGGRPRSATIQGFVSEESSAGTAEDAHGGVAARISRMRLR
jgi:hypothetical protein